MNRMDVCGSVTSMCYDDVSDVLVVTSDMGDVRYMNMKEWDGKSGSKKNGSKSGSVSVIYKSEEGLSILKEGCGVDLSGVFNVCSNGKLTGGDYRDSW